MVYFYYFFLTRHLKTKDDVVKKLRTNNIKKGDNEIINMRNKKRVKTNNLYLFNPHNYTQYFVPTPEIVLTHT